MSKNTIKIDGEKLRYLLESETGLSIYEIAVDYGFSRNIIAEAIRKGKASPIVQMIADRCEVNKEDYILKDEPEQKKNAGQISIDDIAEDKREDLKALIKAACKEAIIEAFNGAKITKGGF